MSEPGRILLVEDEDIIAIIIRELLEAKGFQVTVCGNCALAWHQLQNNMAGFDVIVLDRGLPDMDGMELLRRIKNEPVFANTPVIIETVQDDNDSIRQGLGNGAYYYLTKPFQAEVLLAIVNAAWQQVLDTRDLVESVRQAEQPLTMLQSGSFKFRDLEQARLLANYLARACPQPERAVQGLSELLVNAVEHGNLAISYAEKSQLLRSGRWHNEIQRRLQMADYRDRSVEVIFQRLPDSLCFTIRDQGDGFNWREYLDFSPERAFDLHGRGIAMARKISVDKLEFSGNGNTVAVSFRTA